MTGLRRQAVACGPLLALAVPAAADAHPMAGVGDFYAGMLHPLTTVEHVLPLAALGLLAGQQPRGTTLRVIPAVPAALMAGAALALALPAPPGLQWITIGSMVALGLLVALAASLPPAIALAAAVLPAAAIGWANAAELGGQAAAVRFVPGVALAGLLVVIYGAGCVRGLRAPWMGMAFRVLGSWIAALGVMTLGLR